MSEPKVQLIDPQGNMNLPGMNATGVITASSFSGEGGVVTGLTGSPNLNVGVVTATSFVGDGTGHAANLTGTPNLNLGLTTATSFVGDAVGKAAGLTGTPNLNVGLVTATSFAGNVTGDVTGNITGLAASITPGNNLNVGVATGIQWHGDGSALTGAGSSAYIAQEITALTTETIIDLSYGNLIYFDQNTPSTTVGFASTSPAEQLTFIRNTSKTAPTFTTGGVDFDGTDDCLTLAASDDFDMGTGDFTFEFWMNPATTGNQGAMALGNYTVAGGFELFVSSGLIKWYFHDGSSASYRINGPAVSANVWQHIALVRSSDTVSLYYNGVSAGTYDASGKSVGQSSNNTIRIGCSGAAAPGSFFDGTISNYRIVKGTAIYTSDFTLPYYDLENVTNTKLLCCQSDSSTTASAVTPGTITAVSSPTAGAQTISSSSTSGFSISWPERVKWTGEIIPTLFSNKRDSSFQIFHFTTGDTGASYRAWEEMKSDTDTFGLWSWGYNSWGNFGTNDRTDRSSPTQVGTDVTWSSLAKTDTGGSAAIKTDGTLWLWGRQENGGSGQNEGGETDNYSSPTQIPGTTWSQISGGTENINSCWLATKTNGTIWAWGDNEYGNLGLNNKTQYSSPTQIGTDTTWSHTAGSATEFLAIKTDGTLWGMGRGWNGTLGNNLGGSNAARSSPTQVGTDTTWTSLGGSGQSAAIATKSDGTLWAWGSNLIGGLGDNSRTSRSSPTQIGTDTTWSTSPKSIAGGYYGNAVTKTDGTLWTWGNNDNGELGQNNSNPTRYSSPVQVPGTTWNSVNMSQYNVFATKTDGTLWAWGGNWYGELGQNQPGGSTIRRSSPVQIPGTAWAQGDYQLAGGTRTIFALKQQ